MGRILAGRHLLHYYTYALVMLVRAMGSLLIAMPNSRIHLFLRSILTLCAEFRYTLVGLDSCSRCEM